MQYASILCKSMLSIINGAGHFWWYVLSASMFANTNNYFPIEDRCSGLIYQHAFANILNAYQGLIKSLHQLTKPHGLVCRFPNRHKENKEVYEYIDAFLNKLKEDIGEPIATRYVRDITGMTTRDDNDGKVFLAHHTSNHQCYAQWCFECGSIVIKQI